MIRRAGEFSAAALLVSAGSGFAVAYQYEVADPFVSSVAIDAVISMGHFWRALHFWSSQAFLLLLMLHIWEELPGLAGIAASAGRRTRWTVVSATLPMAVFVLFTGYVLRFDATGQAAGTIAEHLLLEIPVAGGALDRFLIGIAAEGLNRVYLVHLLFTALLWGIGTWYHTRRVILGLTPLLVVLAVSVVFGAFVRAPIDLPGKQVALIKGPWFFLGVQEFLRHVHPLLAGILYPLMPVALVAALPWMKKARFLLVLLGIWLASYALLTLITSLRS